MKELASNAWRAFSSQEPVLNVKSGKKVILFNTTQMVRNEMAHTFVLT